MVDIIVTIPKNYDFIKEKVENTSADWFWWHMARPPRYLRSGETVYFVWRGHLRFKAEVISIGYDEIEFKRPIELPEPWNTMSGFRGFMYAGAVP